MIALCRLKHALLWNRYMLYTMNNTLYNQLSLLFTYQTTDICSSCSVCTSNHITDLWQIFVYLSVWSCSALCKTRLQMQLSLSRKFRVPYWVFVCLFFCNTTCPPQEGSMALWLKYYSQWGWVEILFSMNQTENICLPLLSSAPDSETASTYAKFCILIFLWKLLFCH